MEGGLIPIPNTQTRADITVIYTLSAIGTPDPPLLFLVDILFIPWVSTHTPQYYAWLGTFFAEKIVRIWYVNEYHLALIFNSLDLIGKSNHHRYTYIKFINCTIVMFLPKHFNTPQCLIFQGYCLLATSPCSMTKCFGRNIKIVQLIKLNICISEMIWFPN